MIARRSLLGLALLGGCTAAPPPAGGSPGVSSSPPKPARKDGPLALRVMTWNVMTIGLGPAAFDPSIPLADHVWETRAATFGRWLQFADSDIVGIQEGLGTRDAGGNPSNLMAALAPAWDWANIDHWLPIMFRCGLLERVEEGVLQIGWPARDSPWDRFCSWARLRHLPTGRHLFVFNTHLQPFQSRHAAGLRSDSVGRLIAGIERLNPGNRLPAVVLGDFNARSDENRPVFRNHRIKLAAAGWRNSQEVARTDASEVRGASSYNGFGAEAAGRWHYRLIATQGKHYDYVWIRKGVRVDSWRVVCGPGVRRLRLADGRRHAFFADGPVPSDHSPVLAEVSFGAER